MGNCSCFEGLGSKQNGPPEATKPARAALETSIEDPSELKLSKSEKLKRLNSWVPTYARSDQPKSPKRTISAASSPTVSNDIKSFLTSSTPKSKSQEIKAANGSMLRQSSNEEAEHDDDAEQMMAHAGLGRLEAVIRHHEARGAVKEIEEFYERLVDLGQGAFGKVTKWRTKNAGEGCMAEEVAVKHISWKNAFGSYWPDKAQCDELKGELKMLMILDSPFIIKVREWFEHPRKGIFFVMELCDGGCLQDVLEEITRCADKQARMAYEPRLRTYFRQVTYALSYLHGLEPPIVHRDLKPDNVLMKSRSPDTCIKLIDFGLTSLSDGQNVTQAAWTMGTLAFMAPEQFLEPPGRFTEAMDIWSLGIMLGWIVSATELGSLQHVMLEESEGEAFNVYHHDLKEAYTEMKSNAKSWNKELFSSAPADALDLLDFILHCEPRERPSASDIIKHAWVASVDPTKSVMLVDPTSLFANISSYHSLEKFDRIILNLVAGSATTHSGDEVSDRVLLLARYFRALDVANNGVLSEDELVKGFQAFHHDDENPVSEEVLCKVYRDMDVDHSGSIDYTEFLAASIGSCILTDEQSISSAFRGLDSKQRGKIYKQDLADAIGSGPARMFCEQQKADVFTYDDFRRIVHTVAGKRVSTPKASDSPTASRSPDPKLLV